MVYVIRTGERVQNIGTYEGEETSSNPKREETSFLLENSFISQHILS